MAEIKVEDYANEAINIADTDLFDLTVDLGGGTFESERLTFATLKLILLGVRRFKVTRVFGDYAIAAFTNDLELLVLPEGFELVKRTAKPIFAWSGGGIGAITSSVGTLAEPERYSPGGLFNLFQAVNDTVFDHNVLNFLENWGNTTSIREFIEADKDLDLLTQGETTHILYIDRIK